jgi:hypothetical protein
MVNGSVTLYWRPAVLEETVGWLTEHGYQVVRVAATGWTTQADLHRDLAAALRFPDHYGANLDALHDCLRMIAGYELTTSPEATGFVLVLTGFDAFTARHPVPAHAVLDIFATQARAAMLIGHRMLCLVQSNDPALELDPIGATPVLWNPAEWLEANRRPGDPDGFG